jgi:hypothetical protein
MHGALNLKLSAPGVEGGDVYHVFIYLPFVVIIAAALVVGIALRWWGLLVPLGAASFLAYAWEFTREGVSLALLAALLGCVSVAAGALGRRALWTFGKR